MMKLLTSILAVFVIFKSAESLTCYQQPYTPGITQALNNNNPLLGQNQYPNQNQNQQQQIQQNLALLPTLTCSTTATSCYKFTCFGTNSYTVRGCLDYTQPQYSCQALESQCLGGQGNCYVCNGNNCNGALSIHSQSTRLLALLLAIPIGVYLFKHLN